MLLLVGHLILAQSNLRTTTGAITFNASTPLENIHAVNSEVNAILNVKNGEFASVLLMKDFQFKRALMQEHFNENYVESESYPKAYFSGELRNFKVEDLSSSPKEYFIAGKLTIHGVTKPFATKAVLSNVSGGIRMESEFIIKPEEYNIKVPKLLFKKIAQEVEVVITFTMTPQ